MRWRPYLFSCFSTGGFAHDVAAEGDGDIGNAVDRLNPALGSWFRGETNGKVFFGKHGFVRDELGKDHIGAVERGGGRLNQFTFCYVAPKGAQLPSDDEMRMLDSQLKADLSRFGTAAHEARWLVSNAEEVQLPDFVPAQTRAELSVSGFAQKLKAERSLNQGPSRLPREGGTSIGTFAEKEAAVLKQAPAGRRGMIWAAVSLGAVLAGAAAWELLQTMQGSARNR